MQKQTLYARHSLHTKFVYTKQFEIRQDYYSQPTQQG